MRPPNSISADAGMPGTVPRDVNWPSAMWEQGATAMLLGDVARAREVRDLLAPFAETTVTAIRATCIYGPTATLLARLEAFLAAGSVMPPNQGLTPKTPRPGSDPRTFRTRKARGSRTCTDAREMARGARVRLSDFSQAFAWLRRNRASDVNATITPSIQNCERTASRCVG